MSKSAQALQYRGTKLAKKLWVIYLFTDSTMKPGPGAHSPEKVLINKTQAPSFSLGIRHSEYITPLITDVADWIFLPKWVETKICSFVLVTNCFFYIHKEFFLCFTKQNITYSSHWILTSTDNKERFMTDNGVWLPLQMIIKELLDKLQNAAMNDCKLYK